MQCIIKKNHLRKHQAIAVNSAAKLNRTTWLHWRPGTPQLCSGNPRTRPPHHADLHCLLLATFVGTAVLGSPSMDAPLTWTREGRCAPKTAVSCKSKSGISGACFFASFHISCVMSFHFVHACIQPCREITPRLLQIAWELLDGKRSCSSQEVKLLHPHP